METGWGKNFNRNQYLSNETFMPQRDIKDNKNNHEESWQ